MRHLQGYRQFEGLEYDQMDLTYFDNRYIVGRWFKDGEEAMEYLAKSISAYDEERKGRSHMSPVEMVDYEARKVEGDASLKPYKLYRKPSGAEARRAEAAEFIKKNGIISSPSLRYVTHPLCAYLEYKHISELKRLGINYRFRPISEIDLDPVLQRELKEKFGSVLIQNGRLRFFSLDSTFDRDYIKDLKARVEEELARFNAKLGTDYFVAKTYTKESTDTLQARARRLLNDDDRPVEVKYDTLEFGLQRGHDEQEFLAVVPMDTLEKPKMFLPVE